MTTYYSEHPAMFKNNPIGFIIAIFLISLFGIGLLILLAWYIQTKASKLVITDKEVTFEKGLLNKEYSEVNIKKVRTVKIKQSFFNRIFGVGKIELYTSGDSPEIIASGMPNPNRIRELIKKIQKEDEQNEL